MSKYIIVEIDDEALELMRKNGDETRELIQCKDCLHWWNAAQICTNKKLVLGVPIETDAGFYCGYAARKEE